MHMMRAATGDVLRRRLLLRASVLFALWFCAGLVAGCGMTRDIQIYNDPFEGPTRYFAVFIDRAQANGIYIRESHGGYIMEVIFGVLDEREDVVSAGAALDFMIGGQVHTWNTTADATPATGLIGGRYVLTTWRLPVALTAEQADVLAGAPLTAVRTTINGQPFTLELDDGAAQTVQRNMATLRAPR
jgi:hypothetical protein